MREAWLTRRTFAWASYDVASSVYFGLAPVLLLPMYFLELMKGFANPTAAWGVLAAVAVLASAIAALAAAAAAQRFRRFSLLCGMTIGLLAAMAVLALNPGHSLLRAALAYVAAQMLYFAATTIYESFLPDLLPQDMRQQLSGFGWGLGYAGGAFAILVLLAFSAAQPQTPELLQACFGVLVLISTVLFAAALGMMRREGFAAFPPGRETHPRPGAAGGLLRRWRSEGRVFRLLIGTMLVQMGVSVVTIFTAPILAQRFGQSLQDLLRLLLLIHLLSVPTTFGWSILMSRGSRLVSMFFLLGSWVMVLLLLAFGSGPWMPLATVSVIGCCLGATAAALRGFLAESVSLSNATTMFGFSTVAGRVAAALGPALFSALSVAVGQSLALLSVAIVLACGGALILQHLLDQPLAGEAALCRRPCA